MVKGYQYISIKNKRRDEMWNKALKTNGFNRP